MPNSTSENASTLDIAVIGIGLRFLGAIRQERFHCEPCACLFRENLYTAPQSAAGRHAGALKEVALAVSFVDR